MTHFLGPHRVVATSGEDDLANLGVHAGRGVWAWQQGRSTREDRPAQHQQLRRSAARPMQKAGAQADALRGVLYYPPRCVPSGPRAFVSASGLLLTGRMRTMSVLTQRRVTSPFLGLVSTLQSAHG
jgi:hypothetical protein